MMLGFVLFQLFSNFRSTKILNFQTGPDGTCRCKFYRFNQLPFQHILGKNIKANGIFITEEQWQFLKLQFE
jgi:hypothetical protein